MTEKLAIILAGDRDPTTAQRALQDKLLAGLRHRPGLDVTLLPHLVDLAPNGPAVRVLRSMAGDLVVLSWLHPRAAHWVLDALGVRGRFGRISALGQETEKEADGPPGPARRRPDLPERTIWCLDLRRFDRAEDCLAEIDRLAAGLPGAKAPAGAGRAAEAGGPATRVDESTRPRWYPVVDFDRCTACMECLNFCLFGVYGLDETPLPVVEQPDACRPGCPACARICPEGAILFPQHDDPAIAGDPTAPSAGLKLDLSQLLGGDGAADLAARERQRAVAELDQLVDGLENMDL